MSKKKYVKTSLEHFCRQESFEIYKTQNCNQFKMLDISKKKHFIPAWKP